MTWVNRLVKTYESRITTEGQANAQMAPIAHMNAKAQLEVTLNQEGEFVTARSVEKEDMDTLIPVTEASAGRSSGIAPHGISDTLSYVAGDFSEHCETKKQKETCSKKFEHYMQNLQAWNESPYGHSSAMTIFAYLSKRRLVSDLIQSGLVHLKEGNIFDGKKIGGKSYDATLVRFRVLNATSGFDATWKDASLIQHYIDYSLKNPQRREDVCYYAGQVRAISENHPKGILAANYGAKLVSANDDQGYTYRGRFQNAEQSCALSYEASQKMHSALTWLAKNQGVSIGKQEKRTFVCWCPTGKQIPDFFDELDLEYEDEAEQTETSYRRKLRKLLDGYQEQFDQDDYVVAMGLDAATTGRLSVTYYHELHASDFLERIRAWSESCKWYFPKVNLQKHLYYEIETPIFRKIAACAFGREREGERGRFIVADDRIMKEQVQRLMKCMLEKQPIPFDIVRALAVRASSPMAYSGMNRERVLATACAVISKHCFDKNRKGEQEYMKLDLDNRDRSYLFGRLLAVYEKLEKATYDSGEKREPNAIRLQSAYVNHPMQTWQILEGLSNPYFQKLSPGSREHYRKLISGITTSFLEMDEKILNQGLKETYLLGYYLQRAELNKKKESAEEAKKDEQFAE